MDDYLMPINISLKSRPLLCFGFALAIIFAHPIQAASVPSCSAVEAESADQEMELLNKAGTDDVCAAFSLGYTYYTRQNYPSALRWWGKAADQGNARAAFEMAIIYRDELNGPQDLPEMIRRLQQAAELGLIPAQLELGTNYVDGTGVEKDLTKAMYWYEKAAKQGSPEAQYLLGWHYWTDERGMEDMAEGDEMGERYTANDRKAVYWTCLAAQQNHASAQYDLSHAFDNGRGELTPDYAQAALWLYKAAENGSEKARAEIAGIPGSGDSDLYTRTERWAKRLFKKMPTATCQNDPKVLLEH